MDYSEVRAKDMFVRIKSSLGRLENGQTQLEGRIQETEDTVTINNYLAFILSFMYKHDAQVHRWWN